MNTPLHHRRPTHEEISARARQLWHLAGEPPSRDTEFWFAAQARIDRECDELTRALNETRSPFAEAA